MKTKYYSFNDTVFYAVNEKTLSVCINENKPFINTYLSDVIKNDDKHYQVISKRIFNKAYNKAKKLITTFKNHQL